MPQSSRTIVTLCASRCRRVCSVSACATPLSDNAVRKAIAASDEMRMRTARRQRFEQDVDIARFPRVKRSATYTTRNSRRLIESCVAGAQRGHQTEAGHAIAREARAFMLSQKEDRSVTIVAVVVVVVVLRLARMLRLLAVVGAGRRMRRHGRLPGAWRSRMRRRAHRLRSRNVGVMIAVRMLRL